jgi:hypothetical protein
MCGAVAWIVERPRLFQPHLTLSGPDGDWASKLQHAVQDMDGDGNFGDAAFVRARAQAVADHLLAPPNRGLNSAAFVVSDAFCQAIRPFLAMYVRWLSRCVGLVPANSLGTAVERGGTITAASGSRSMTARLVSGPGCHVARVARRHRRLAS